MQRSVATAGGMDCARELVGLRGLEDVADGAGVERREDALAVGERGEHDDGRRRPAHAKLAGHLDAIVSAAALVGLALSFTTALLDWKEAALRPAVVIAIGSELVAVAALAPLALRAPSDERPTRSPSGGARARVAGPSSSAAGR